MEGLLSTGPTPSSYRGSSNFCLAAVNKLEILTVYLPCFQVCKQVSYGIQALFGPSDLILGSHVQSLCDALVSHVTSSAGFLQRLTVRLS